METTKKKRKESNEERKYRKESLWNAGVDEKIFYKSGDKKMKRRRPALIKTTKVRLRKGTNG